jgi:hypothetical protein
MENTASQTFVTITAMFLTGIACTAVGFYALGEPQAKKKVALANAVGKPCVVRTADSWVDGHACIPMGAQVLILTYGGRVCWAKPDAVEFDAKPLKDDEYPYGDVLQRAALRGIEECR